MFNQKSRLCLGTERVLFHEAIKANKKTADSKLRSQRNEYISIPQNAAFVAVKFRPHKKVSAVTGKLNFKLWLGLLLIEDGSLFSGKSHCFYLCSEP